MAEPGQETKLTIIDFNVHPRQTGPFTPETAQFVTETVVPAGKLFQNAIITCLPYRIITRDLDKTYTSFMIDDERIIGFKVGTVRLILFLNRYLCFTNLIQDNSEMDVYSL